jgi:serine/threonine protein kinase
LASFTAPACTKAHHDLPASADTKNKSLQESTVAAILKQVAEGLNYLHQNGLIGHDQFSSSNLFVDR